MKLLKIRGSKPQQSILCTCVISGMKQKLFIIFDNDKVAGENILELHREKTLERLLIFSFQARDHNHLQPKDDNVKFV